MPELNSCIESIKKAKTIEELMIAANKAIAEIANLDFSHEEFIAERLRKIVDNVSLNIKKSLK